MTDQRSIAAPDLTLAAYRREIAELQDDNKRLRERLSASVSGDARARANVIYDAALVDGTRGRSKLMAEQDIASITTHIEQAIIAGIAAALTAERAEGSRAMREEAMRRLKRICINEAPADMTSTQVANWAMGIACDEIRALAPGEDGIDG